MDAELGFCLDVENGVVVMPIYRSTGRNHWREIFPSLVDVNLCFAMVL